MKNVRKLNVLISGHLYYTYYLTVTSDCYFFGFIEGE